MKTMTRSHAALRCLFTTLLVTLMGAPTALANQDIDREQLGELLRVKVRTVQHMALNPVLVHAVRSQNLGALSLELIKERDAEWRESKGITPFKRSLQTNNAGRFLRGTIERLQSLNEAFLTDNQGANVAAFPATSDYWQGDEEKWTASFNGGAGRVFVGELELDESTQTYAVQISAPVIDRGTTIGVLVVGVTIDYLEARGG